MRTAARRLFAATLMVVALAVTPAGPAHAVPPMCADTGPSPNLFATSNTAVITDPNDVRLQDLLQFFEIQVNTIAFLGGASPAGSTLVDGVFWSDELDMPTYERARMFHLCGVEDAELRGIADQVRRQFDQEAVLTFTFAASGGQDVTVEVPGIDVARFHDALVADPVARDTLAGGSVTPDGVLTLVATATDLALVRELVERAGGQWSAARTFYGVTEFVA